MRDGESSVTTDHATIRNWAELRGGWPTVVITESEGTSSSKLKINFYGPNQEKSPEEIPWTKFYKIFDKDKLSFLYQEKTNTGLESRFYKLIEPKVNK